MQIKIEVEKNPLAGEPLEGFPGMKEPDCIVWLTVADLTRASADGVFAAVVALDCCASLEMKNKSRKEMYEDGHQIRALFVADGMDARNFGSEVAAEFIAGAGCDFSYSEK